MSRVPRAGTIFEKGEAPHSADRTANSLRMGSVTHYQDGDSVLNKHTSNPLRASTSLHSKNLLAHARLTQPPTVYLNPWGEGVKVERSRPLAAGRSCLTPLEAKPPTSPKPQLHPTTCSCMDAPAPPAGSRDAAAARCPRRARASGARQASACQLSSGRTPARATADRHRRHRRSVAFAPSRLVRRPVGRAPLSLNVCGRST